MLLTSALINKKIKLLQEEKEYWLQLEHDSKTYIAAVNEEPVIPEYDYETVTQKLNEIDLKICKYKHAINLANTTHTVKVGDSEYTIDLILVRMAQLNKRKAQLDHMRKALPKQRLNDDSFRMSKEPEYEYVNYNLKQVNADFEKISKEIIDMQIVLDEFNQTVEINVDEL